MARFPSSLLYIIGAILAKCPPGITATDTAFIAIDVPESASPPIATNAFHVEWTYENYDLDVDAYPEYSDKYTIIIAEPIWPAQCLDLPDSDWIIFSTTVSGIDSSVSLPASKLYTVSPDETATVDFLFISQDYIRSTWTEYFFDEWDEWTSATSTSSFPSLQTCSSIRLYMTSPTFAPATNMATDATMTMTTTTTTNTAVSTNTVIPDGDEKSKDGDGGPSTGDKVGIGVGVPSGVIVLAGAIFWAYSKWWKRE